MSKKTTTSLEDIKNLLTRFGCLVNDNQIKIHEKSVVEYPPKDTQFTLPSQYIPKMQEMSCFMLRQSIGKQFSSRENCLQLTQKIKSTKVNDYLKNMDKHGMAVIYNGTIYTCTGNINDNLDIILIYRDYYHNLYLCLENGEYIKYGKLVHIINNSSTKIDIVNINQDTFNRLLYTM